MNIEKYYCYIGSRTSYGSIETDWYIDVGGNYGVSRDYISFYLMYSIGVL